MLRLSSLPMLPPVLFQPELPPPPAEDVSWVPAMARADMEREEVAAVTLATQLELFYGEAEELLWEMLDETDYGIDLKIFADQISWNPSLFRLDMYNYIRSMGAYGKRLYEKSVTTWVSQSVSSDGFKRKTAYPKPTFKLFYDAKGKKPSVSKTMTSLSKASTSGAEIMVRVGTDSRLYHWVDEGTRPHQIRAKSQQELEQFAPGPKDAQELPPGAFMRGRFYVVPTVEKAKVFGGKDTYTERFVKTIEEAWLVAGGRPEKPHDVKGKRHYIRFPVNKIPKTRPNVLASYPGNSGKLTDTGEPGAFATRPSTVVSIEPRHFSWIVTRELVKKINETLAGAMANAMYHALEIKYKKAMSKIGGD